MNNVPADKNPIDSGRRQHPGANETGLPPGAKASGLIASDWKSVSGVDSESQPARRDTRREGREPFASVLAAPVRDRRGLAASLGVHAMAVVVLGGLSLLTVREIAPPEIAIVTFMTAPAPIPDPEPKALPPLEPKHPPPAAKVQPPREKPALVPPAPVLPPAVLVAPDDPKDATSEANLSLPKPAPTAKRSRPVFDPATIPEVRAQVRAEVRTNVFSEPSDATPETKAPARIVQTGGFGSPDAVPGPGRADPAGVPSKVGAFDLPAGPGQGNGTAGSNGVRGVVTGAGFGAVTDGAPRAGSPDGTAKRGTVTAGAFGDGRPTAGAGTPARAAAPAPALETPIEILSKPRPAYTAEARALKIEGEVLLEVVFTAAGQVRVLRIVRGLGHGLDESAAAAAQQMKFKPARRSGLPVDSTVTLHMVFQLA